MTAIRVSLDSEGNFTSQEMLNSGGGVVSSADYQSSGVIVERGFGSATVSSADQLQDDDLVSIDGVQMPASSAKEMGLIDRVFAPAKTPAQLDPTLSYSAATSAADGNQRPGQTGHEGYDSVASDLTARVEAGDITEEEGASYDLAAVTVALAGVTVPEVVEVLEGTRTGDLGELDVDPQTRQVAEDVHRNVTDAATKSANAELGPDGFKRLSDLAKASPVVNDAIRQYASMRALGRSSDTWSEFLAMAEAEMAGGQG